MDKLITAAIGAALVTLASPALAGWTVQKSEPDPFAPKATSTFIGMELGDQSGLSIRCREGTISLLLVVQATGAAQGDHADVKLIADAKSVIDDNDAEVISSSPLIIGVQFGDEHTLAYLNGAQKLSVRYELPGFSATVSFGGGKSLADVIKKALKACGKSALIDPPPAVSTTAEPGTLNGTAHRMPAPSRTTSSRTRTTSGPASRSEGIAASRAIDIRIKLREAPRTLAFCRRMAVGPPWPRRSFPT
jgi:hypothetical protein